MNRNPSQHSAVVVNDDPTQLTHLSDLLQRQGVEPQPFTEAEAALIYMRDCPPDLIVTDVHMRDIDGWRFCRLLRSPEYPHLNTVPVLVVSAMFSGDEPRRIAIDIGVDAFLSFPVDEGEFSNLVKELLNQFTERCRPNVLILDDSPTFAGLLKQAFEKNGYRTTIADTEQKALAAQQSVSFDLAVLDCLAPDGKGDRLLDALQAEQPECVCLMTTGEPDPNRVLEWMKRGAAAYLQKPFDPEKLIELSAHAHRESTLLRAVGLLDVRTRALQKSEASYRQLVELAPDVICRLTPEGCIAWLNSAFEEITDWSREEWVGKFLTDILHEDDLPLAVSLFERTRQGEQPPQCQLRVRTRQGNYVDGEFRVRPLRTATGTFDGVLCIVQDITNQVVAREDEKRLREQLHQTQKMESIGLLAGGVAHDFNNMLGVILGHSELVLDQLDPMHEARESLNEIRKAAERSANLTRQLLAFARKQAISPRVLDLLETISDMHKMLKRLIGEEIELIWEPSPELWRIKMDPSQVDQLLANLCVNARDAIDGMGTVILEVRNCVVDEDFCVEHAKSDPCPGEYVCLRVTDTGMGMDPEMLPRIFDPFFTTKELGRGTGLGLATVYGILRQNDGFVTVQSRMGKGTTFDLYIPRYSGSADKKGSSPVKDELQGGRETILIVDDEQTLLDIVENMLRRLGYHTLKAATPSEAINVAKTHAGQIDLLLTDVIMPEMNGCMLAKNIQILYPDSQCVFMSGYNPDVIVRHGVLDPGVKFIHKPMSMKQLAEVIRTTLAEGADIRPSVGAVEKSP